MFSQVRHRSAFVLLAVICLLVPAAIPACSKSNSQSNALNDTSPALPAGPAAVYQAVFRSFTKADLDTLNNDGLPDKAILAHRAEIEKALEASGVAACDFGVDRSQGMAASLPHLTYVRTTVRLLRDDAERLVRGGDVDGAAKRAAAAIRIGQQVAASAQCGMEQLVACASVSIGANLVNEHPELPRAAWKTDIQAALAAVRQSGAVWSGAALRSEGDMVARSLRNPSQIYLEDAATMDAWKRKSPEDREQAAAKILAIHAEVARVWSSPDAKARLDALGERASSEGVGQLFVAASKVREACTRTKESFDKAEAALR